MSSALPLTSDSLRAVIPSSPPMPGIEGPLGARLDHIANTAAKPCAIAEDRLAAREYLRRVTTRERVSNCGHAVSWSQGVRLQAVMGSGSVAGLQPSGIQTCSNVWLCPVCSGRISSERSSDLRSALESHFDQGGRVVMLTFTARHSRTDSLETSWDKFLASWRRMGKARGYREAVNDMGSVGFHRTIEVTHGSNGWHVHAHVLYFLEPGSGVGADALASAASRVQAQWLHALDLEGLSGLMRGQDFRVIEPTFDAGKVVAWYLHKGTYRSRQASIPGLAFEVSRFDSKRARREHRSPFQILEGAMAYSQGDLRLWWEWEAASHGRRAHYWSNGLRDRLGLLEELDDEDLAGDGDPSGIDLVEIPASEWRLLMRDSVLYAGALASAVGEPSLDRAVCTLSAYLTSRGISHRVVFDPLKAPPERVVWTRAEWGAAARLPWLM